MGTVLERPVSTRPCARPGCRERLGPSYRSDAKFHSPACRAKAAREKAPLTSEPRAASHDRAYGFPRNGTNSRTRPSQREYNGQGTPAEPFFVPRMSAEEAERRRPDWHGWTYGSERNPIHAKRGSRP
jgi:hypothetical protein